MHGGHAGHAVGATAEDLRMLYSCFPDAVPLSALHVPADDAAPLLSAAELRAEELLFGSCSEDDEHAGDQEDALSDVLSSDYQDVYTDAHAHHLSAEEPVFCSAEAEFGPMYGLS